MDCQTGNCFAPVINQYIYLKLDVLLCSITEYFYELCYGLVKIQTSKNSAILHSETSNTRFIIQCAKLSVRGSFADIYLRGNARQKYAKREGIGAGIQLTK